jgi:hypothetical protein
MDSNLFIRISPDRIHPGETVSVRISVVLEPNSTSGVMVRFAPPKEPVQPHPLDFRADPLGFASETVNYPNDIENASTLQHGNYTILVQNLQTGGLLGSTSFEVAEQPFDFRSWIPEEVLFPLIIGGIGGLLTYWYNSLSAKRETKATLNQKKAESFLTLRPHYAHVSRGTRAAGTLLDRQRKSKLARQLRVKLAAIQKEEKIADQQRSPRRTQLKAELERIKAELERIKAELERINGKVDYNEDETRRDYELCFYNLAIYVRERRALIEKFGAYALSDPRGEILVVKVDDEITTRLQDILGIVGFIELGRILSQGQTFSDLKDELCISHSRAYRLYEEFKKWIDSDNNTEEIAQFIRDLRLFSNILAYERTKMFEDWYTSKDGINQALHELRKEIIPELRSDKRYFLLTPDYLNYP